MKATFMCSQRFFRPTTVFVFLAAEYQVKSYKNTTQAFLGVLRKKKKEKKKEKHSAYGGFATEMHFGCLHFKIVSSSKACLILMFKMLYKAHFAFQTSQRGSAINQS